MNIAEKKWQGTIEISPDAVAAIAGQVVMECYGVVGMADTRPACTCPPRLRHAGRGDAGTGGLRHSRRGGRGSLGNGNAEFLRWDGKRGVEVHFEDERVVIDLYVILEYGVRISEVAHNLMSSVRFNVEKALGTHVVAVNVHVEGLRVSSPD